MLWGWRGRGLNVANYFIGVIFTIYNYYYLSRLDELVSQEGALKLKEKLMEQEKDLVVTQNEWMSQELESKSTQLIQLRKERFTSMADLNSQISAKNEEVRRG